MAGYAKRTENVDDRVKHLHGCTKLVKLSRTSNQHIHMLPNRST